MNEKELYPGHAEELRRREDLRARIERAHGSVLPGALREAFGSEPSSVALAKEDGKNETFNLQPVTLGLTANLERIKSPLLDMVRIMREELSREEREDGEENSMAKRMDAANRRVAELKFEEEQIAETVFVFTRPQKRIRKLLEAGRQAFREVVMDELGDRLHPAQMAALQRACSQHYIASFATIIGYGAPPPEKGEAVFPPPSPSGATGSAGG